MLHGAGPLLSLATRGLIAGGRGKYVKASFIASSAVKGAFTYLRNATVTTMVTGVLSPGP
ncbi:hypothetical protein SAMN04489729_6660 [Amycolatopsis lurida]|nr:hypothetical protein SAMN04489729_6660 [Amycolatopsis lurida]